MTATSELDPADPAVRGMKEAEAMKRVFRVLVRVAPEKRIAVIRAAAILLGLADPAPGAGATGSTP